MSDHNQLMESIKNELQQPSPSKKKILSYLFKDQSVPYPEIIEIVGAIFRLHPEAYMEQLYKGIRKRMRKLYGDNTLKEMEKTIIEHFCLYDGEQILLEFDGAIQFFENRTKSRGVGVGSIGLKSSNASLYVTNHRIIAQGRIGAIDVPLVDRRKPLELTPLGKIARKRIMNYSRQEKCYGYIFPISNLSKLRLTQLPKGVHYKVDTKFIRIIVAKSMGNREEIVSELFEILNEVPEQIPLHKDDMSFLTKDDLKELKKRGFDIEDLI